MEGARIRDMKSKRSKYNVSRNTDRRSYDDIVFDSEMEMRYYRDVVLPQMDNGTIVACERQKPYVLQSSFTYNDKRVSAITYKADFCVQYADGSEVVIDIKGQADATAKIKRKMFWKAYPDVKYIWLTESKIDGGWRLYEDVQSLRRQRKKAKNG